MSYCSAVAKIPYDSADVSRVSNTMDPRYDIYTSKCDRKDIVDFIKEVEKYPCLYDKTNPEYANKFHNRKAWVAIAKKVNTTVPDCRDKWRKIRISFMRSLKQQQSDRPPMRSYYLTDELHFLLPFLKIVPKDYHVSAKEQPMEVEVTTVTKTDITDGKTSETRKDIEDNRQEIHSVKITDNFIPNIMNGHKAEQNYIKHVYSDDIQDNPRKMFLLSILPDVVTFTEQEMRTFRREVIDVVDRILFKRISN